jgi:hypothetical protein
MDFARYLVITARIDWYSPAIAGRSETVGLDGNAGLLKFFGQIPMAAPYIYGAIFPSLENVWGYRPEHRGRRHA